MSYGISVFVEGNEIIYESRPLNPVWSVRCRNIGNKTVRINIPPGNGTLEYTSAIERPQIDQNVSAGGSIGSKGSLDSVSISGNTATLKFSQYDGGFSKFDLTFYRSRS